MLSLALILPGCGEGGAAGAGGGKDETRAAAPSARAAGVGAPMPRRSAAAKHCRAELGDLLDAIESLGNTLAVGLDYEQYLGSVNGIRASYADVAAERLGIVCLGRVAAPAERAVNIYIDAANAWGDCLASSCDTESIEPKLQREWEGASTQLARARSALRDLS